MIRRKSLLSFPNSVYLFLNFFVEYLNIFRAGIDEVLKFVHLGSVTIHHLFVAFLQNLYKCFVCFHTIKKDFLHFR